MSSAFSESLPPDHVLIFAPPAHKVSASRSSRSYKPRRGLVGFRTRPLVEQHVQQNLALWRSVKNSSVSAADAAILSPRGGLRAIALPRQLHKWLAGLPWSGAAHAVLCILHDATCSAPEWRLGVRPPAPIAPSVAIALSNLPPHPSHCPPTACATYSGKKSKCLPLVTPASKELDELLQSFAGEELWTVPVIAVGENEEAAGIIEELWPHWKRFRELGYVDDRLWCAAANFMDLVTGRGLSTLWREVEVVFEMGGVTEAVAGQTIEQESSEGAGMETQAHSASERLKKRFIDDGGASPTISASIQDKTTKALTTISDKQNTVNQSEKCNSYFALLPRELLTQHLIPYLCSGQSSSGAT